MFVSGLQLYHFRNYLSLTLPFENAPVVFYGDNGSGKTNVLEALSFLSPGRGLRGSSLKDATCENAAPDPQTAWSITANLIDEEAIPLQLRTTLLKSPQGRDTRSHFLCDKSVASLNAFAPYLRLIWLTPDMDRLFLDAPSVRRRFIDRLIFAYDLNHGDHVRIYEKIASERLAILKNENHDASWLNTLEHEMAVRGAHIIRNRQKLCEHLNLHQIFLSPTFPRFTATMDGGKDSSDSWEEILSQQFRAARTQDKIKRSTSVGPQRNDWHVRHAQKNRDVRLCSTGEQKIILASCLLTFLHYFLRNYPCFLVLLMDEIVSHLDLKHRVVLFEEILSFPSVSLSTKSALHVFMTGTDRALFDPLGQQGCYRVMSEIL